MLAVLGEGGGGAETHDVGTGKGLRDGQADELVTSKDRLDDLILEFLGTEVHHGGQTDDHTALETVTETTSADTDELLGEDQLVEVVKLLALDAGKELATVEVLAGTHAHGVDAVGTHLLDELDVGTLAVLLASLGDLDDLLVDKLAPLALEVSVRVVEVGRVVGGGEPGRLGVRNARRASDGVGLELGLLALDVANDEALVLGLGEDLATVKTEEGLGGVLAGDLFVVEDVLSTGVELGELGDVVDLGVDDNPEVASLVVLGDLLAGVLLALRLGGGLLLLSGHCEGDDGCGWKERTEDREDGLVNQRTVIRPSREDGERREKTGRRGRKKRIQSVPKATTGIRRGCGVSKAETDSTARARVFIRHAHDAHRFAKQPFLLLLCVCFSNRCISLSSLFLL